MFTFDSALVILMHIAEKEPLNVGVKSFLLNFNVLFLKCGHIEKPS